MATIEGPPIVSAPRYSPGQILGWTSFFCMLFVIAFAAVRIPTFRDLLLPLVTMIAVFSFGVFLIGLWIAALVDTASFSPEAWRRSGHVRWVWTGVAFFLWPIGSLLWYAAIRPQIARAEQGR